MSFLKSINFNSFSNSSVKACPVVRESVYHALLLWRTRIERSANKNLGSVVPITSKNLNGARQPREGSVIDICASRITTCLKYIYVFAQKRTRWFAFVVGANGLYGQKGNKYTTYLNDQKKFS